MTNKIEDSKLTLKYIDDLDKSEKKHEISFKNTVEISGDILQKLSVFVENNKLIKDKTVPNWRQVVVTNSIKNQVLSPYTSFLCKIKEKATAPIDEQVLIKLKNFMEGTSKIQ